jgi:hypothetical protein
MNPEDEQLNVTSEYEQSEKPLTEVVATKDEFAFFATADTDDPKIGEWMQKNGIKFGDKVVVHVEGLQDIVMGTDKEDFGTRDREATEKWREQVLAEYGSMNEDTAEQPSLEAEEAIVEAIDTEIDRHSAEIAEKAPRVSKETAHEFGEEGLEAADVPNPKTPEPASSVADILEGRSSGPMKFDMEAATKKLEEEESSRLIPTEELSQVKGALSEMLRQYTFKYDSPGPESQAFENYTMPHNLVGEANSVLGRVGNGYMGKEAASLELGALLAGVKDPNAADAIMQRIEASKVFTDEEVHAINEEIASVVTQAGRQAPEGEHFRYALSRFQEQSGQAFREGQKADAVSLAILGASIGVYARMGDASAIHAGMSRLSVLADDIHKLQK